jgi:type IV secretion system protein VirD4
MALAGQSSTVDDGGRQHQPELGEVAFTPQPEHSADDLGLLDDDDSSLPLPTQLDPRLQRAARLAALDPDDGIAL